MIKILCTRSIPDMLVQEAASENIDVRVQEFIAVQPNIGEENSTLIHSLLQADEAIVVFTSKHAVNILADFIAPQKESSLSPKWKIYCISEVTLQTAKKRFPNALIEGKGAYAADLADLIQQKNIKEVWFFCGNIRRDVLPDRLRNNGIRVNEITIYETKLTAHHVPENYDGIVFFSPSGVDSFFSVNRLVEGMVCFAIGRTTASAIKNRTDSQVIISEKQDAQVMIQTVINYYKQKQLST